MSDLIYRDDALKALSGLSNNTDRDYCNRAIRALPAVQPEPWNPATSPGMTDLMVDLEDIPDLVPLPDTVWICDHMGECGSYYPNAVEAEGNHGGQAIAYIKAAAQPHVNEAPKSEHDARDVLTLDAAAIREAALREVLNAIWRDDLGEEATAMYNQIVALLNTPTEGQQ